MIACILSDVFLFVLINKCTVLQTSAFEYECTNFCRIVTHPYAYIYVISDL